MIDINDITLTPIDEKHFSEIATILNNDISSSKFVSFYNPNCTNGIIFNGKLIGLFTLNKFIDDNIAIHIALLKEFRNKGICKLALNKIVLEYGNIYPESQSFLININYKNEIALNAFKHLNWSRTYRFDEIMNNEGGEFFIIYEKQNPNYNISCLKRKGMGL